MAILGRRSILYTFACEYFWWGTVSDSPLTFCLYICIVCIYEPNDCTARKSGRQYTSIPRTGYPPAVRDIHATLPAGDHGFDEAGRAIHATNLYVDVPVS